jgi:branched-chain amino acid transport system ATP-binding protein
LANPLLEVQDLNVAYGDAQALWDIGFSVSEGDVFGIIGSNGAGKSTILKSIAGLVEPLSGQIRFSGADVTSVTTNLMVERGVSMVPEGRGLFTGLTVLENLELGAFTKRPRSQLKTSLEWVFDLFPRIKDRTQQVTGGMSGGEQQMVAIGRALMSRPKLLMLDEPSLGLAPLIVKDLFAIIKELNTQGVSILLVEQNIHQALKIAHRAIVIKTGRITMTGTGDQLAADPEIQKAYMGALG